MMDAKLDGLGESLNDGLRKRGLRPVVMGSTCLQRSLDLSYRQREPSRAFRTEEWQSYVGVSDTGQLLQELIC